MSQGRAKPLLATESGQDITDKLDASVRTFAVFAPELEALLQIVINRLNTLIEYERVRQDGL